MLHVLGTKRGPIIARAYRQYVVGQGPLTSRLFRWKGGRVGGWGAGEVDGSNGEITISGWATMIRRDSKGNYALYQCEMCGKSYSWKSSYHRHLREECGKQQRAKCKNCGRQYRWRDSLNKHLKYECGVEPKYTCSVCGRKFRHKQVLTSHLRKFHWIRVFREKRKILLFFLSFFLFFFFPSRLIISSLN